MARVFRRKKKNGGHYDGWFVAWTDENGRRHSRKGGDTKREAQDFAARTQAEVNERKRNPFAVAADGSKLVAEAAEDYLGVVRAELRSAGTVEARLRRWVEFFGPGCRLREVTPKAVEQYRAKRRAQGRSVATINRELEVLKRFMSVAVDWDLIPFNPVAKVRKGKGERRRELYLTRPQVASLLAAARLSPQPGLATLVTLAVHTGARQGELMALRWADVNFEHRTVSFPMTKSGKPRVVPLNKDALAALRSWKRRCGGWEHLFTSTRVPGQPLRGWQSIRRAFQTACREAGLPEGFRFHDLRHTHASLALQGGATLEALQRVLGHSSFALTQRYAHLSREDLRKAVEATEGVGTAGLKAVEEEGSQED